ncbi:unnamed protein product [Cuscuta campestris]|uniref:Uncharacterized protein n=1 Tax=Cuscuta campestris TaxID=132261 RepID=A0A484LV17_9ASTE|nr:unnamed protein product [Cuscuta campestris]
MAGRTFQPGVAEGQSTTRPPLFDGTNYAYWKERMRIFIQSNDYDSWMVIKHGETVPTKIVDGVLVPKLETKYTSNDMKKMQLSARAINFLYCAMNPDDYRKISRCKTANEMWNKLEVTYERTSQVKDSKIDLLTHEYELFMMMENETIDGMFERFSTIVSNLDTLGKHYEDHVLVPKILRSLTPEWKSTVNPIKEGRDYNTLTYDALRDVAGGPTGGKAGPAGSQGKKKKVRRSQKKKATKPNRKARMEDALSRLDEEDESSSFERASAFDRLGDPKSKKPRTCAFDQLQDTRPACKGDLRETLKERRGESTATSKVGSEERRKAVEDKEAADLWRMYEQLEKRLDTQNPYRQAVFSEVTPFSRRIMSCPLPDNFKTPQIKAYNGQACEWFHKLPKRSIEKWSDLAHKFLEHFSSSRRQKLPLSHLLNVKIRKGEQLREFINRWEKEARDVQGADDQALIAMLQAALPQGDVRNELRRNPLSTYQEMLARAKYLALEEEDDEPPVRKEKKSGPPVAEGKKRKDYGKGPNPTRYHASRHPVHAVLSLPAPPQSRESYGVQDAPKYCEYHRNSTHNTSECVTLKKEMDQLIARGPPPRSERPSSNNQTWRRPAAPAAAITAGEGQEDGRRHLGRDCDDLDEEERQDRRHLGCRFIMGGNTGGDSVSSRKKWKNMVHLAEVQRPSLPKRKKKEPLVFTNEDYPPVLSPHRDALVIKVEINNVVVHCTLVNTGSSVNVMYSNTFKGLGLSRSDLKPIHMPLSGFTGDTIEAEGTITVKAGVGDGTHRLWLDMEFMVVQLDCAHHLILGRPGLEDLECVISPAHLCLKFNTPTGKEEGQPRAEPADELEEVTLDPARPEQKVKVGKTLPPRLKEQLLEVLQAFKVLFAWGQEDMPGVDPKIICHRLAVDPAYKPVKQKKRFLSSERREFVSKQVTTLQSIGHIWEVRYPECPNALSRVCKWGVFLGSFQIEFKPRPAIKGQALADFVVECTAREEESNGEKPEGNWWTVYTDGSSVTDASGGGFVAISPEGFKAYYSVGFRFKVSNNEAEYEALLCGLRLAASLKAVRIQVRCDSKLIVGHVTGEFEAKDERMKKYRDTALELLKAFGAYQIEQVPREENAEADILSKLAKVVKRRAPSYTLECGRLYKRSYNGTLLRCLRRDKAQKLMEEIHEGICSVHQGAFTMSRKVTLQGYFWPTITRGCAEYVRKCKVCEEFQRVPGRPATNYTPISTTIPFSRWGIDLVGILPRGTGNNTYLVVAIDYFTKWVEAAPVPTITEEQMRKFVSKQILCRFGVPQQIITDNGTQFEARGFNEFLESWGIKHSYAAVGYPQTNGQVENTNRTIVDGLKKRITECKSAWVEELPYILWTYRTTPRKATGETPFSLKYGFETRAPAETSLLSYRVETFDAQENEENLRAELHLIDE